MKCFKCSGIGHIQSECPNRRVVNLIEEFGVASELKEDPPIYDNYNDHEDDEITWSDQGEALVIQRAMSASKVEEDPEWLRHNIFHTRCTSNGKICDLIIDSGSCENVVAQEMVDKLNLKTERRPTSYNWLGSKRGMR